MTALNTILADNWDGAICTKPSMITISTSNWRTYQRVVATQKISKEDEIQGIVTRAYYSADSHDLYDCIITTMTSEADMENMITAIKKICATYSPTSDENILQWEGGDIEPFNGMRWIFRFRLIVRRAGISAYT